MPLIVGHGQKTSLFERSILKEDCEPMVNEVRIRASKRWLRAQSTDNITQLRCQTLSNIDNSPPARLYCHVAGAQQHPACRSQRSGMHRLTPVLSSQRNGALHSEGAIDWSESKLGFVATAVCWFWQSRLV